jgi:plasmid maintenance system killer protein
MYGIAATTSTAFEIPHAHIQGAAADRQPAEDLKVPPGNRLHPLSGNRQGQHAISINDQWRICFRFEDGDAYEVEVCDYH